MSPEEWMATGGTLGGWIDRGGTLPGDIITPAFVARTAGHRLESLEIWEHWRKENADYFAPLHDPLHPRTALGRRLFGDPRPHGPFGPGF